MRNSPSRLPKPARQFVIVMAAGLLAMLAFAAPEADPPDLYIAPYLQNATPASMTVMWETADPVVGIVEFGQRGRFVHRERESAPRKIHEIHLTDLKPGELYNYRVRYGDRLLPPAEFRTAPAPGTQNWRFVVYGDNRSNPDTHTRNVEQIMKARPSIILNSGDLVAAGSRYEEWKSHYFDPLRGVSQFIPVFPCLGNHEQNAVHYYNYHSLPGEKGERYYSFDYANAHIVALNSNRRDAPFELGEEQTEWLIADLEKHRDAKWTFVFFHHPLFRSHPTRGIEPQRWVWQPIFDKYGVDLVINGHDHYYMRSYPVGKYVGGQRRGVYHLISGGGGANTYPMVPKPHAAFRRRIHHITVIDVMNDRLVGRAVDIDGNTFDAFVIDQQAVNSPEEFISYEVFEIERDLSQAIYDLPVTKAGPGGVEINTEIEVPNRFDYPLQLTVAWNGTNGWKVTPQSGTYLLEAGNPIRIPIAARAGAADLYPAPTLELRFNTPDGEKAFRNDAVTLYPLRFAPAKSVKVPRSDGPPQIDGDLSDAVWKKAYVAGMFVDAQGAAAAERAVEARLLRSGDTLYLAARVEAPDGLTTKGYEQRDESRLTRNDHLRVSLAVDDTVYSFLVNARGAVLDARGEENDWNSGFTARTAPQENGWQAELAIPLGDLAIDGKRLRVNVSRFDETANSYSELMPTFGHSPLDHRVPMYQADSLAAEAFADLKLE